MVNEKIDNVQISDEYVSLLLKKQRAIDVWSYLAKQAIYKNNVKGFECFYMGYCKVVDEWVALTNVPYFDMELIMYADAHKINIKGDFKND